MSGGRPIDNTADQVIRKELDSDEQLVWSGKPKTGLLFRRSEFFMIPFSLFMTIFCLGMAYATIKDPQALDSIAAWIGLIFMALVIMFLLVGRYVLDSYQRAVTFYGVTNKRIIIISGIISQNRKSLRLHALPGAIIAEKRDGSGSIFFSGDSNIWAEQLKPLFGESASPSLEAIQNVRQVNELIIGLQRKIE